MWWQQGWESNEFQILRRCSSLSTVNLNSITSLEYPSSVTPGQYIVICHTWSGHEARKTSSSVTPELSYLNKPRGKLHKRLINNVIPDLLDNEHSLWCCSPLQDLTAWVLYRPIEQNVSVSPSPSYYYKNSRFSHCCKWFHRLIS